MKKLFSFFLIFWFLLASLAWAGDGFTQEDRERLIRLETTLKVFMEQTNKRFEDLRADMNAHFEQIDKRFEQTDKRFEELRKDMNARFEQIDKRFEQIDKRIEELRQDMNARFEQMMTFLWILTGIFTTLVAVVIGFAYWDRRTIIRKAREETIEHLEREGKLKDLLDALRELAKKNPELAKVLRDYKLL
ncbi:coiled-coil domain-containing protein [Thermodesulfatator autotrophicus]|uniref:t-SNARE coiled-coil homology domain-containing protein n=1 Tax=Thermodesulfatator autotrophicus TaxID=1795632 RepID=A0A177EAV2_9BACT|nr:hypothetical protein [Thermodesulfatator autotrophicus]OAG28139.1 hypothetical protein TH606_03090 [Thermodesulfatator autotrophicus]